ncbi:fatty acid desaturase family protein [Oceanicola granulosus HTCC2516]|uniref:Fatty acid desaturase family protein n=1 Tax=Oceanicola granulosus (strain ATCC BAA-861 / DSM 15982 / KCTC 12143 / HTCC2516) TaxID=314256 RepID=Q2CD47_OCEGH|nr:fatty acid desaturase family protein [Oceanicola granulosus]EAR50631.1 fatty acid desaturase family protein [Oceanicola granulosus HTCC2516]
MQPGRSYVSPDEIRALSARSDLWGVALLVHCWGMIAGAVALFALWPNPLTFLLAVALIGSRQLGLAILMHEAAHNALFANRRLNEWAGEWLCGRPILADLPAYRRYHLQHHRFTQTDADPDLALSSSYPTTRASMARKLLRDLTGRTGLKLMAIRLAYHLRLAGEAEDDPAELDLTIGYFVRQLNRGLLANAVIFALLWAAGAWWWYLAFWLLPLLTWFQLVLRVRNIAEHGAVERSEDPFRNVRTTRANWLERTFFAPYWVNWHLEHHLVMHIPARNLPRLHALLVARGLGPRMTTARGYGEVLRLAAARPA